MEQICRALPKCNLDFVYGATRRDWMPLEHSKVTHTDLSSELQGSWRLPRLGSPPTRVSCACVGS